MGLVKARGKAKNREFSTLYRGILGFGILPWDREFPVGLPGARGKARPPMRLPAKPG